MRKLLMGVLLLVVVPVAGQDLGTQALWNDLEEKPLRYFSHEDLSLWLDLRAENEPSLTAGQKIEKAALKMMHTPFRMSCASWDFSKVNCYLLANRAIAIGLAGSWEEYYLLYTRLCFKDGVRALETKNHYTLCQWYPHNAWLFEDLTDSLGAKAAVKLSPPVVDHLEDILQQTGRGRGQAEAGFPVLS